jgi:hypothetical protein
MNTAQKDTLAHVLDCLDDLERTAPDEDYRAAIEHAIETLELLKDYE